jgi:chromosome segregation ATPase
MKISKWLFWGAFVLAIILFGGFIYETISSRLIIRTRNDAITEYRADNQRLRDGLDDAEDRIVDLQGTVGEYQQGSEELRKQLRASQDRAAELADLYRVLAEENLRLGEAISHSSVAAGSIAEHSKLLGDSIDRAWGIIEQYTIPIGSK